MPVVLPALLRREQWLPLFPVTMFPVPSAMPL
jgi:hypothetical protein